MKTLHRLFTASVVLTLTACGGGTEVSVIKLPVAEVGESAPAGISVAANSLPVMEVHAPVLLDGSGSVAVSDVQSRLGPPLVRMFDRDGMEQVQGDFRLDISGDARTRTITVVAGQAAQWYTIRLTFVQAGGYTLTIRNHAATATPTPTPTDTPVPTATVTPMPTATVTPMPTATVTPMPTATVTPVPTATVTPMPTATPTPVPADAIDRFTGNWQSGCFSTRVFFTTYYVRLEPVITRTSATEGDITGTAYIWRGGGCRADSSTSSRTQTITGSISLAGRTKTLSPGGEVVDLVRNATIRLDGSDKLSGKNIAYINGSSMTLGSSDSAADAEGYPTALSTDERGKFTRR